MKNYLFSVVLIGVILCAFAVSANAGDVVFSAVPRDMQVYARDVQENTAEVAVAGEVVSVGFDSIVLTVYRDDVLYTAVTQALSYSSGSAAFTLNATITAELINYDFVVTLYAGGTPTEVERIEDVVAGDILLVNGQSNSEAARYATSANGNQHQFLRTFGTRDWPWTKTVTNDLNWRLAEGDQWQGPGAVGQWPLRTGRRIVDTYSIPIGLINNAQGGQAIGYYQRNDSKPMDYNNNYGLTLFRCWEAGVTNNIRAILWYQGESDNNDGAVHETGFRALYSDWMENYGPVEKVYVCQVRVGCGVDRANVALRDRQRRFEDDPTMRIVTVPTTGINAHDGCHYQYVNGYETLGNQVYDLLARDLYGSTETNGVSAPNIAKALFTTPDRKEVTVVMRNTSDPMVINSGAEVDFLMEGASVTPVSGRAASNTVVLALSRHGMDASGISYTGHAGPGAWVTNSSGVGLLCFYNIAIEPQPFPQPAIANDAGASDILGTSATMQGYVVSTGQSPTTVSLYWGTVDGGTDKGAWQQSTELGENNEGPVAENIGSLLPSTAYYYRYLAANADSESWADESAVFATLPAVQLNNSPGATPIYTNAATMNGVLSIASATPTTVRIYWGLSDGGTNTTAWEHNELVGERTVGLFSAAITGLTPATRYYYRSYGVNSLGEGWASSSATFSTLTMSDTWIREMEITFAGYTRGTALVNYPALVALNESIPGFSYSQFGKADGTDLRFLGSGMQELNYEIDTWNFNGTSYVWVQVPLLQNATTKIQAIWGNSTAPQPACVTNGATWSEGFAGVWHMNAVDNLDDSSGNGWNGILAGIVTNCDGVVGGALDFTTNGPVTSMTVGDIDLTTGATMMAIINVPGVMWEEGGWFPDKFVFNKGGSYALRRENIDYVWPEYWTPSLYRAPANGGLNWEGWRQIASTYDAASGTGKAYYNGILQTANISTGPAESLTQNNNSLQIGYHVKGKIDEARISNVPRSEDWLWACFENHADPAGFSQCSEVQVIPEPAGMVLVMLVMLGIFGKYK